jgi:hypothetical protein
LPYDADSGSFWQLMFGPVGRVYALTCTHTPVLAVSVLTKIMLAMGLL